REGHGRDERVQRPKAELAEGGDEPVAHGAGREADVRPAEHEPETYDREGGFHGHSFPTRWGPHARPPAGRSASVFSVSSCFRIITRSPHGRSARVIQPTGAGGWRKTPFPTRGQIAATVEPMTQVAAK